MYVGENAQLASKEITCGCQKKNAWTLPGN